MQRVVILGAGFGGLELATTFSEAVSGDVDVALIDKNDAFVFGYSKLDLMFGRTMLDAVLFGVAVALALRGAGRLSTNEAGVVRAPA